MSILLSSKLQLSSEVLAQPVDDEMVLLDLQSESYFGLDETGTRIWQLLEEHNDLQKVFDTLLEEYDVDRQKLENDLKSLVKKLIDAKLISLVT